MHVRRASTEDMTHVGVETVSDARFHAATNVHSSSVRHHASLAMLHTANSAAPPRRYRA
jgi:hypothetical protein